MMNSLKDNGLDFINFVGVKIPFNTGWVYFNYSNFFFFLNFKLNFFFFFFFF